jgi:hypothetical protein
MMENLPSFYVTLLKAFPILLWCVCVCVWMKRRDETTNVHTLQRRPLDERTFRSDLTTPRAWTVNVSNLAVVSPTPLEGARLVAGLRVLWVREPRSRVNESLMS